jgi:hypothetical protein
VGLALEDTNKKMRIIAGIQARVGLSVVDRTST